MSHEKAVALLFFIWISNNVWLPLVVNYQSLINCLLMEEKVDNEDVEKVETVRIFLLVFLLAILIHFEMLMSKEMFWSRSLTGPGTNQFLKKINLLTCCENVRGWLLKNKWEQEVGDNLRIYMLNLLLQVNLLSNKITWSNGHVKLQVGAHQWKSSFCQVWLPEAPL